MYHDAVQRGMVEGILPVTTALKWVLGAAVVGGSLMYAYKKLDNIIKAVPLGERPRTWRQKVQYVYNFLRRAARNNVHLRNEIFLAHKETRKLRRDVQEARAREKTLKEELDSMAEINTILEQEAATSRKKTWGSFDDLDEIENAFAQIAKGEWQRDLGEVRQSATILRHQLTKAFTTGRTTWLVQIKTNQITYKNGWTELKENLLLSKISLFRMCASYRRTRMGCNKSLKGSVSARTSKSNSANRATEIYTRHMLL
jgi:predicted RNase H-like nuclease (RuvC/YqgF family)